MSLFCLLQLHAVCIVSLGAEISCYMEGSPGDRERSHKDRHDGEKKVKHKSKDKVKDRPRPSERYDDKDKKREEKVST